MLVARAEDLAGVLIILMIAASAALAGWESIQRLLDPPLISNLGWVMVAAVVGVAGNQAVGVFRIRVSREIDSAARVADGHHAQTDGSTSLAVSRPGAQRPSTYPVSRRSMPFA